MKIGERFLLVLYGLISLLIAGGIGALLWVRDRVSMNVMGGRQFTIHGNHVTMWGLGALAILLAIGAVWMFMMAFRREHSELDKSSVAIQDTEDGDVRVSVQAMDMLVNEAISRIDGIADVKTSITNHGDAVSIHVDLTLNSDVYIPNSTMMMQRSIKSFVEEYSGITVREVTIMVSKIMKVKPRPPLQIPETINHHDDDAVVIHEPEDGVAQHDGDTEHNDDDITEKDLW